jgi:hypothetical protein
MGEPQRSAPQILVHGFYGAVVAVLFSFPVQIWWAPFGVGWLGWIATAILTVLGFTIGALFGGEAIEFVSKWFWWW